uniref:Uncharacterized protein n=1 Tax=Anguilla anguilla TaxID=7936 RepID=A0A0E9RGU6_ANGAN
MADAKKPSYSEAKKTGLVQKSQPFLFPSVASVDIRQGDEKRSGVGLCSVGPVRNVTFNSYLMQVDAEVGQLLIKICSRRNTK